MTSSTQVLARYIAESDYEELPQEVVAKTKWCILDCLGCALGATELIPSRIITEFFGSLNGTQEATVWSSWRRQPVLHACYVNASLSNMLDYDDTYSYIAHPGSAVIPAAVAMAEKLRLSGRELINAIVLGYEVSLRIGTAIVPSPERYEKVWGLATWQIFGATTAACRLLRLDEDKIRAAFGLSGANAPVPFIRKEGLPKEERPFHWLKNNYGWAAMGGILATELAAAGFHGNRYVLDGEQGFWIMAGSDRCDFSKLTAGLGKNYLILMTSYKLYPCCLWIHTTLDAALDILQSSAFDIEDIRRIRVLTTAELANNLSIAEPYDVIDAQFSLPYMLSLALTRGSISGGLSEQDLHNPKILELARKVEVEVDPEADRKFLEDLGIAGANPSTVIVETRQKKVFRQTVQKPRGHPERPATEKDLEEKFLQLTEPSLGTRAAQRLLGQVLELDKVGDVGTWLKSIRKVAVGRK